MSLLTIFGGYGGGGLQSQPALGPQVVLFPHEPICFQTRGDFALYALAAFTKREAVRLRERYTPLIEVRRVEIRV